VVVVEVVELVEVVDVGDVVEVVDVVDVVEEVVAPASVLVVVEGEGSTPAVVPYCQYTVLATPPHADTHVDARIVARLSLNCTTAFNAGLFAQSVAAVGLVEDRHASTVTVLDKFGLLKVEAV